MTRALPDALKDAGYGRIVLLPSSLSEKLASSELTPEDIEAIAEQAGVHPAIVAGRWQREHADYRRFSKMLGRGEVSTQLFVEDDD